MTTSTIRKKLISYLANADDNKVKAIYTLLEKEILDGDLFILTNAQLQILEKEREMHLSGESKSYTRDEAGRIIRNQNENTKSLIADVLGKKYVIISVIGSHAGDEADFIFTWKTEEIKKNKKTYWLIRSRKAKTQQIQEFCNQAKGEYEEVYCLFIAALGKNGARPTTAANLVREFSHNKIDWYDLSDDTKIKGKIDSQSTALVLSDLQVFNPIRKIDLGDYSEVDITQNVFPVKFALGASTSCCKKIRSNNSKSSLRTVVAWAKLDEPYSVWVK